MTSALKAVLWILVALVVIGGAYYWYESRHPAVSPVAQTSQTSNVSQAAPTGPTLASGSDASDAGLTQDLSGIDSQISTMNSDTAAIDQGLSDTPVSQQ